MASTLGNPDLPPEDAATLIDALARFGDEKIGEALEKALEVQKAWRVENPNLRRPPWIESWEKYRKNPEAQRLLDWQIRRSEIQKAPDLAIKALKADIWAKLRSGYLAAWGRIGSGQAPFSPIAASDFFILGWTDKSWVQNMVLRPDGVRIFDVKVSLALPIAPKRGGRPTNRDRIFSNATSRIGWRSPIKGATARKFTAKRFCGFCGFAEKFGHGGPCPRPSTIHGSARWSKLQRIPRLSGWRYPKTAKLF
ncbi:MAG: hypothetical protein HZC25_12810 [Rhodospirillales bacterium]|nr:hypothetical protein [Rhodospirillales bacterium]